MLVPDKGGITVSEVMAAYIEHAQSYYRKNSQPTSETSWITDSLRPMRRLCDERSRGGGANRKSSRASEIAASATPDASRTIGTR